MKKFLFFILFLSPLVTATAQTVKNGSLVIGKVDSIHSKILNENRKVWIYLPASASDTKYQKQHYPILYLLDAESHFSSVTGMIQQLSEINGNSVLPEMIVVGIPNKNRTRDLTPTNALTGPEGKKYPMFEKSGGGEKFAAFIEKELMPHIDSLYAPSPQRAIIGHSFGGLTVMNILVHHPELFNQYIAIDPSMWWHSRKLLNETPAAMANKKFERKSLFVGIANTMTTGMDTTKVISDTSGDSEHIRAILALDKVIKNRPANGLQYACKYYNDDNHGSVPLIAEYDALHTLYQGFGLSQGEINALSDPNSGINIEQFIAEHYQRFSNKAGVTVLPPEPYINNTGIYLLAVNQPERAHALFSLNIRNYPKSFSAYNSMGNYYASISDQKKAIEYYSKALAIQDNPETRTKLKKLRAGN
ncbi:MAG: alpha/beta hydrolase-fold protein [Pedobacter sp.]|uniref:alpha/beta hydrolase-fold protein n=1 Tax=Pedobacter sp. TaxID=1411316 RepID=UPI003394DC89